MVLPAKIFEMKNQMDLISIGNKLQDLREEIPHQTSGGENIVLLTEILDLHFQEDLISGILSEDFVNRYHYKRKLVEDVVTEEAHFTIMNFGDRVFMIVIAPSGSSGGKKLLTGRVANKVSSHLFGDIGIIVEKRISHDTLKELHESNPQSTKLIWFDNVDIPGVEKLCLSGVGITNTDLYRKYLEHGRIWYVVFEVQKRGIVVGITRKCGIVLFSKGSNKELIEYIQQDLLSLIE